MIKQKIVTLPIPSPEHSADNSIDDNALLCDPRHHNGAVSPPIYQSSLFTFNSYEQMLSRFRGETDHALYSRVDNPTVRIFEKKIAQLERADDAIAFSSGMGAISNAILSQVQSGDKILCINHVYPDTYRFLKGLCQRFAIEVVFVDGGDLDAIARELVGAKLFYLESPNSWMMQQQHLSAIAKLAKAQQVITIIDNSWASPLFQKPLTLGIDIVLHSASKYISGHSDTVAGVVASSQPIIDLMTRQVSPYLGAKLSANEAWLLIRGLRTLKLRMAQHQRSGLAIIEKLINCEQVKSVYHPAVLPSDCNSLMGYGSLFSFELVDELPVDIFCNALRIFQLGVSWGGYESLVIPSEAVVNQQAEFNSAKDFGVSSRLIRLYVGLENVDELWGDLQQALITADANRSHSKLKLEATAL